MQYSRVTQLMLASAVLVVILCAAFPWSAGGHWVAISAPFVWRDVLFVYLVSAIPVAALLTNRLSTTFPRELLVLTALCMTAAVVATMVGVTPYLLLPAIAAWALRTVLALMIAIAINACAAAVTAGNAKDIGKAGPWNWGTIAAAACLALVALPEFYLRARNAHDVRQLQDFVEQSRFGEAHTLALGLRHLDPSITLPNREPLDRFAWQLEAAVRELRAQVAVPLRPGATSEERLERAQALAMLGEVAGALTVLETIDRSNPARCNLQATIHENCGEWAASRHWYGQARTAWRSAAESPEQAVGLLSATQGLGYCERKLGRIAAAEAAYLELLALSPTADTHFLLAQFYEDVQRSSQAAEHARRAATLAPLHYREASEQLISKLESTHFGCLTVFLDQYPPRRAAGRLPP